MSTETRTVRRPAKRSRRPTDHKLTADQARRIAKAEADYSAAKRAYEEAEAERERIRKRYRSRIPHRKTITVGGVTIRWSRSTWPTFRFKDYREAGHKVTPAMAEFVGKGERENWTVKGG